MCVCVCVRARARVRACACVRATAFVLGKCCSQSSWNVKGHVVGSVLKKDTCIVKTL